MSVFDVIVVGAGAAGLATTHQLLKRGLKVRTLEQQSDLGGNWRFGAGKDHASVAACTYANTTKQIMGFADFEMPGDLPDYPHHSQLLEYLRTFARTMGISPHVTFDCAVETMTHDGVHWVVRSTPGEELRGKAVCIATGHHSKPRFPSIHGDFSGSSCHAKYYGTGQQFHGQRVLVVGLGASGADIAVDLSHRAASVHVSVRRGYHIVPKYVLGRPLDHFAFERKKSVLPHFVRSKLTDFMLTTLIGDPTRFGFPKPTHGFRSVSPTISQELLARIGEGSISIVPGVDNFSGTTANFLDGTSREFDSVIFATGYCTSYPYLPQEIRRDVESLRLYKRVIPTSARDLFVIGLVQPLGAFWPVSDSQAAWVGDMLIGKCPRPTSEEMRAELDAELRTFAKRGAAQEIFMQVDQEKYLLGLWRAMTPGGPLRAARMNKRQVAPFTELVWERIARTKERALSKGQPARE